MTRGGIDRLARRAKVRIRIQRFVDVTTTALLPALVLSASIVLLGKLDWVEPDRVMVVLGELLAGALLAGAVAAAWPIATLPVLIRLDQSNAFSDRLSSAWSFLERPAEQRTPEMELHVERTLKELDQVEVAPAVGWRRPTHLGPAILLAGVLAFTASMREPRTAVVSAVPIEPPPPHFIVDLAALRPEMRQIEALEELAERTDDPEIRQVRAELADLVERLERGVIDEKELLNALDDLEARLAELDAPPPADMSEDWAAIAEGLRDLADQLELPDALAEALGEDVEAALDERLEQIAEALAEGDEQPLAEALEQLAEMLDNEELSDQEREALADLVERFADLFDPTNEELRERFADALRDLAELEERYGQDGGTSSRGQRRVGQARERLAETQQAIDDALEGAGESSQTRQRISETLEQAAESLREPETTAETTASPETPEGPPREGDATDTEASQDEPPDGERARQRADADVEREEGEGPPDRQREGDESEGQQSAERQGPGGQGSEAEEPGQPTPGEGAQPSDEGEPPTESASQRPGQAGSSPGQAGPSQASDAPTSQQQASNDLREAAETLRDVDRAEARQEAQARAADATEGIRENLQRASQPSSEEDTTAEQTWDDFMDRASGQPPTGQPPSGQPPSSSRSDGAASAGSDGPPPEGDSGEPDQAGGTQEPGGQSGYGTEAGGDALGDESTDLDSTRTQVAAEAQASGEGDQRSTGEVISDAAVGGFATVGYREVYQEYAEAAEAAIEAEEVPAGFARFIERYFNLIEPRD